MITVVQQRINPNDLKTFNIDYVQNNSRGSVIRKYRWGMEAVTEFYCPGSILIRSPNSVW